MAEQISSQQAAQETTSTTVTVDTTDSHQDVPTVVLTLRKPKTDRKVQWTTGTVDNEHMDKKKSKCCCIYKKPRAFDESSSSDSSDDECDHCQGHVEKKKKPESSQTSEECKLEDAQTSKECKPEDAQTSSESKEDANTESKPEDVEMEPPDENSQS